MLDDIYQFLQEDQRLIRSVPAEQVPDLVTYGVLRALDNDEALPTSAGHAFVVLTGQVRVENTGPASVAEVLQEADVFGDLPDGNGGSVSASAEFSSILLEVPVGLLDDLFLSFPGIYRQYLQRYAQRILLRTLEEIPAFQSVPPAGRLWLRDRTLLELIGKGRVVIRQGDVGESFFIIIHGVAAIQQNSGGVQVNLAQLGSGDYFGEWSLLTGAPRAATVRALTTLQVAVIDRETFLDFIQTNPLVRDRIDLVAHNRQDAASAFIRQLESTTGVGERLAEIRALLRH